MGNLGGNLGQRDVLQSAEGWQKSSSQHSAFSVLDTSILVRGNERSLGLARDLLISIVNSQHRLLLSNEMLHELAKVLRHPRLQRFYDLSDSLIYDYVSYLSLSAEIVPLNPLVTAPIRDVNDVIEMQTAIIGEADILCARDEDFFHSPAAEYLKKMGVAVIDDVALMKRLRS